jgi:hypothetical protein
MSDEPATRDFPLKTTDRRPNAQRVADTGADRTTLILVCIIICLVTVCLIALTPDDLALTPEQINQLPLWGP